MEALAISDNEAMALAVMGGLLLIQMLFYGRLYMRIPRHKKAVERGKIPFTSDCPPLSIIIYAHEQRECLEQNLPAILEQDYPLFEVIVITDGADDGTTDYLTQAKARYPYLYHSFVPDSSRYISHKKLGITLGIKASRYEWLVMTEPDCRPRSGQWLRLLARNFTPQTGIVLGHSSFARAKGWLNLCAAYDNLLRAMRYLGFALSGSPCMGLGRNLAYRKQLFYDNKGFSEHLNLLRGDDDLFINRVADGDNTRVETDPGAVMERMPCTPKDWREEKIGYASTARFHRGLQRYAAGMETGTRLLFHALWTGTLAAGILHGHWLAAGLALLAFLVRFAWQAHVTGQNVRALGEAYRHRWLLPVFDLLQPIGSLRCKAYCLFRKKSDFMRK